jgi:hypothetical protein
VNCGPRSILLHCYYRLPFTCFIYILASYYLLPLDMFNPLFTINRWDWQPHCKLGQSTWLCCVQVPRCCWCKAKPWTRRHINCPELSQSKRASTFWSLVLSPTGSINFGFILREDLLLCSSHFLLGFPTGRSSIKLLHQNRTTNKFLGAIAGEKEDFCKRSLSLPIFYFVIVLLYFIFACIFLSKLQKKLVPLIACIPLLLLLVHYVVP